MIRCLYFINHSRFLSIILFATETLNDIKLQTSVRITIISCLCLLLETIWPVFSLAALVQEKLCTLFSTAKYLLTPTNIRLRNTWIYVGISYPFLVMVDEVITITSAQSAFIQKLPPSSLKQHLNIVKRVKFVCFEREVGKKYSQATLLLPCCLPVFTTMSFAACLTSW